MSIPDEIFKNALDVALKKQGILKRQRNNIIAYHFMKPQSLWDGVLNDEEQKAREYQAAKKEARTIPSEFEEQCSFVLWFKKTYPGVVIMSIRNHGSRTPRERVDQMREGLHPGAADLFIPEWFYWLEFKRSKGGVISREQLDFAAYVIDKGYAWDVAYGFEDAKEKVQQFVFSNNDYDIGN